MTDICNSTIREDLEDWDYDAHFYGVEVDDLHPVVQRVEDYIDHVDLASHRFFATAAVSIQALELWMSQELVMTNAFSQIVLSAAGRVANVHTRSILAEVAYGEHGRSRSGLAAKSHPWLLHKMGSSVGLSGDEVKPVAPTKKLISTLESKAAESTLVALAWIGVGNERLIAPEYEAIEGCFEKSWSQVEYKPFLHANVSEDVRHSRLCFEAASSLIVNDETEQLYYNEAVASVDARWSYFDALAEMV